MSIKAVLFDLDGTLLPMDQDIFVKAYFGALCKKLAPLGFEPKKLVDTIWRGTEAMVKNDGSCLNKDVFWKVFIQTYGEDAMKHTSVFDEFYELDFDREVSHSCGYTPNAALTVEKIKSKGYRVVLATNPIFPTGATYKRIKWAGLDRDSFELITTYDNSRHCKPNLDYYRDILNTIGLCGEECLMVGNDVDEDMVAQKLGMKVFLLPECLINKQGRDISEFNHGNMTDLLNYIETLN